MNNDLKIYFVLMFFIVNINLFYFLYFPSYIIAWGIGWVCSFIVSRYIFYLMDEREIKKK